MPRTRSPGDRGATNQSQKSRTTEALLASTLIQVYRVILTKVCLIQGSANLEQAPSQFKLPGLGHRRHKRGRTNPAVLIQGRTRHLLQRAERSAELEWHKLIECRS